MIFTLFDNFARYADFTTWVGRTGDLYTAWIEKKAVVAYFKNPCHLSPVLTEERHETPSVGIGRTTCFNEYNSWYLRCSWL